MLFDKKKFDLCKNERGYKDIPSDTNALKLIVFEIVYLFSILLIKKKKFKNST